MTRISIALAVFLFATTTPFAASQQGPVEHTGARHDCGTHLTPDQARRLAKLEPRIAAFLGQRGTNDPIVIPLAFHIVRRSDGTGGIPMSQIDQGILDANAAFAPGNVSFCSPHPIDYIDDDVFYDQMTQIDEIDQLRSTNVVRSAINIYCVEAVAVQGTLQLCGISSFPNLGQQGIVMRNSCMGLPSNPSTFPHEIGHYCLLYHTHESAWWGPECVDGSNCASAGDRVCDTPADPRLGSSNVDASTCDYTGSDTDPCQGALYDPPTRNVMSYSRKTCRTELTPGQLDRFRAVYLSSRPELWLVGCEVGISPYCLPNGVNSTNQASFTRVTGSLAVADNAFELTTDNLPPGAFGFYLAGVQEDDRFVATAAGRLCIADPIGRVIGPGQVQQTPPSGTISVTVDLTQVPTPTGFVSVMAGETRMFQYWHRDNIIGQYFSGFSSAVAVTFR